MSANNYDTVTTTGGTLDYREVKYIELEDGIVSRGDPADDNLIIGTIEVRVRAARLIDVRITLIDEDGHYGHTHEWLYCGNFVAHWLSEGCPHG